MAMWPNAQIQILIAVKETEQMLGWMILFALMAILAPIMTVAGNQTLAPQMGGLVFALLFFLMLGTRWARSRASRE
jgi:hypothetical protein